MKGKKIVGYKYLIVDFLIPFLDPIRASFGTREMGVVTGLGTGMGWDLRRGSIREEEKEEEEKEIGKTERGKGGGEKEGGEGGQGSSQILILREWWVGAVKSSVIQGESCSVCKKRERG